MWLKPPSPFSGEISFLFPADSDILSAEIYNLILDFWVEASQGEKPRLEKPQKIAKKRVQADNREREAQNITFETH